MQNLKEIANRSSESATDFSLKVLQLKSEEVSERRRDASSS